MRSGYTCFGGSGKSGLKCLCDRHCHASERNLDQQRLADPSKQPSKRKCTATKVLASVALVTVLLPAISLFTQIQDSRL